MYYIGVDLGGTKIAAGITDEKGRMLHNRSYSIPTKSYREYPEIIKDMAVLAREMLRNEGLTPTQVKGVGIGSPGILNASEGMIIYANNLNFRNVPIRDEFQKNLNLPVFLDNDANCAALAESIVGAASGSKDSITITLGTGIGSGIVIDGKIYRGFNQAAAELGHMVIVSKGEQCACGRLGCWEAYASATALIRQTKRVVETSPQSLIWEMASGKVENITPKTVFEAERAGDATACEVLRQYRTYLAEGLLNVIHAFQPEVLVLGGGISKEREHLLVPLRQYVDQFSLGKDIIPQTRIKAAETGNDAGIIGAAMLCLNQ